MQPQFLRRFCLCKFRSPNRCFGTVAPRPACVSFRRNLRHRFFSSFASEFLIGLTARGAPLAGETEVSMNPFVISVALRPTWKENLYMLLVVFVVLGAILS